MVRENEPTLLVMYVAESIRASKNESPIANNSSRGWGGGGHSFPTMQEVRATSVDHRKIAWKSRRANTKPLTFTIVHNTDNKYTCTQGWNTKECAIYGNPNPNWCLLFDWF